MKTFICTSIAVAILGAISLFIGMCASISAINEFYD